MVVRLSEAQISAALADERRIDREGARLFAEACVIGDVDASMRLSGPPIRLYRGAAWPERRKHRYGFSWTSDRSVARGFAQQNTGIGLGAVAQAAARQWGGGVVLETLAPADAVLLLRQERFPTPLRWRTLLPDVSSRPRQSRATRVVTREHVRRGICIPSL